MGIQNVVVGKEMDKEERHRDIVDFDSLTVQRPYQVRRYMIQKRMQGIFCYDSEKVPERKEMGLKTVQ